MSNMFDLLQLDIIIVWAQHTQHDFLLNVLITTAQYLQTGYEFPDCKPGQHLYSVFKPTDLNSL